MWQHSVGWTLVDEWSNGMTLTTCKRQQTTSFLSIISWAHGPSVIHMRQKCQIDHSYNKKIMLANKADGWMPLVWAYLAKEVHVGQQNRWVDAPSVTCLHTKMLGQCPWFKHVTKTFCASGLFWLVSKSIILSSQLDLSLGHFGAWDQALDKLPTHLFVGGSSPDIVQKFNLSKAHSNDWDWVFDGLPTYLFSENQVQT